MFPILGFKMVWSLRYKILYRTPGPSKNGVKKFLVKLKYVINELLVSLRQE